MDGLLLIKNMASRVLDLKLCAVDFAKIDLDLLLLFKASLFDCAYVKSIKRFRPVRIESTMLDFTLIHAVGCSQKRTVRLVVRNERRQVNPCLNSLHLFKN